MSVCSCTRAINVIIQANNKEVITIRFAESSKKYIHVFNVHLSMLWVLETVLKDFLFLQINWQHARASFYTSVHKQQQCTYYNVIYCHASLSDSFVQNVTLGKQYDQVMYSISVEDFNTQIESIYSKCESFLVTRLNKLSIQSVCHHVLIS